MAKRYQSPPDAIIQYSDREAWAAASRLLQQAGFPARKFEMSQHGEVRVNIPAGRTIDEIHQITGENIIYNINYLHI